MCLHRWRLHSSIASPSTPNRQTSLALLRFAVLQLAAGHVERPAALPGLQRPGLPAGRGVRGGCWGCPLLRRQRVRVAAAPSTHLQAAGAQPRWLSCRYRTDGFHCLRLGLELCQPAAQSSPHHSSSASSPPRSRAWSFAPSTRRCRGQPRTRGRCTRCELLAPREAAGVRVGSR